MQAKIASRYGLRLQQLTDIETKDPEVHWFRRWSWRNGANPLRGKIN